MARFQIENRITRLFNQPRIALATDIAEILRLISLRQAQGTEGR